MGFCAMAIVNCLRSLERDRSAKNRFDHGDVFSFILVDFIFEPFNRYGKKKLCYFCRCK